MAHLFGLQLCFQIRHLRLGLGQHRRDIIVRQRDQKIAGRHCVPFLHRSLRNPAGQAGDNGDLIRRHHLGIQRQQRRMRIQLDALGRNPPAAFAGRHRRRLRRSQLQQHKTGHAKGQNQQGKPSFHRFGHVILPQ